MRMTTDVPRRPALGLAARDTEPVHVVATTWWLRRRDDDLVSRRTLPVMARAAEHLHKTGGFLLLAWDREAIDGLTVHENALTRAEARAYNVEILKQVSPLLCRGTTTEVEVEVLTDSSAWDWCAEPVEIRARRELARLGIHQCAGQACRCELVGTEFAKSRRALGQIPSAG